MTSKHVSTLLELLPAAIIALIIPVYLAYVDEGTRNFEWAKKPNEWITVIIVFCLLFFSQYLARIVFLREQDAVPKVIFSFVLGMVLLVSAFVELVLIGKAFVLLKHLFYTMFS